MEDHGILTTGRETSKELQERCLAIYRPVKNRSTPIIFPYTVAPQHPLYPKRHLLPVSPR